MDNVENNGEEIFESSCVENECISDINDDIKDNNTIKKGNSNKKINIEIEGTSTSHPDEDGIDFIRTAPTVAFEAFNGKFYETHYVHNDQTNYNNNNNNTRIIEAPQDRFSRIRNELTDLLQDLNAMNENQIMKDNNNNDSSIWHLLQKEAEKMMAKTKNLGDDLENQLNNNNLSNSQSHDIDFKKILNQLSLESNNAQLEEEEREQDHEHETQSSSSSSDTRRNLTSLERRVFSLETLLGSSSNVLDMENTSNSSSNNHIKNLLVSSPFPVIDTLARLEKMVNLLDDRKLESLRTKAKAVYVELEAMTKEKSRSATSVEQKAIDAALKVDHLASKAQNLEAISSDLPNLLIRLKTLESTHLAATSHASRVEQMEILTDQLENQVAENAEVVHELKQSMASNLSTFMDNVERIEARINALEQSK